MGTTPKKPRERYTNAGRTDAFFGLHFGLIKNELEQNLNGMEAELFSLRMDPRFIPIEILKIQIELYLSMEPFEASDMMQAQRMFTELKIKVDFITKRNRQIEKRRLKLDEFAIMLDDVHVPTVSSDAMRKDESLVAGMSFKTFCFALKMYESVLEKNGNSTDPRFDECVRKLRAAIERFLLEFNNRANSNTATDEDKRKHQLVLDSLAALNHKEMIRTNTALKNKKDWSRDDESKATELYLQMLLKLSELKKAPVPKNLKEGSLEGELVLRIQNEKESSKLVVKPISKEIKVEGFAQGGGASREMLGSVMADKLQEMLGIELNCPVTRLVSIDGGMIGLETGTKVAASAQAWSKSSKSILDIFKEQNPNLPPDFSPSSEEIADILAVIPKEEIQNKAVFDLIALHCDRHVGNFMVDQVDKKLVPIDHGNILPTKEGLVKRRGRMSGTSCALYNAAVSLEKLSPELCKRIQSLNVDEFINETKKAQLEMKKATPEADKGDLDEGLENSKRSIEFLKVASKALTLKQIYDAYSNCQRDIFFTLDLEKDAGFRRAIMIASGGLTEKEAKLKEEFRTEKTKDGEIIIEIDWRGLWDKVKSLGWCMSLRGKDFKEWGEENLDRLSAIVARNIKRPKLETFKVDKKTLKEQANETNTPVDALKQYLNLGGEKKFMQIWHDPFGRDYTKLEIRVNILESLVGIEKIRIDI